MVGVKLNIVSCCINLALLQLKLYFYFLNDIDTRKTKVIIFNLGPSK